MNWIVKATIQKFLAAMPYGAGEHLNRELPRLLGRRPAREEVKRSVQTALAHHADIVRQAPGAPPVHSILELGTGYNFYTALPLALLGYEVTTLDLSRDVRFAAARSLAAGLETHLRELQAASLGEDRSVLEKRLQTLLKAGTFEEFLQACDIRYLAPYDLKGFVHRFKGHFDYIYSHCVFEHIPPEQFPSVLRMLATVGRPGARFSHQVDMRDHRSSEGFLIDKGLSYLDYLRFSDRAWRFWNGNPIAYTNRWRKPDYVQALDQNGFVVEGSIDDVYTEGELPLPLSELQPEFRVYPETDLRVMSMFIYGLKRL